MIRTYRIRRVDDAQPLIDLRAMFRGVFGFGRLVPACVTRPCDEGIRFVAMAGPRAVGHLVLLRPESADGAVVVQRLDAEPEHQLLGCREALLDTARQWAVARGYAMLEARVPSGQGIAIGFYRANGFYIVVGQREPGTDGMNTLLRQGLSCADPQEATHEHTPSDASRPCRAGGALPCG